LFVAIELTDQVRTVLADAQAALKRIGQGVRWVSPEQLHLTVKFLGEVDGGLVDRVAAAIRGVAERSVGFEMDVDDCGCFPPRGDVRIVWAGADEPSGAMRQCVEQIERELECIGFPRERQPFSAHITLGRVREDRSRGVLRAAVEGFGLPRVAQPVRCVTLMSSVLSPQGPIYAAVSHAKLGQTECPPNERC
jgi:2'-5' RNA ligase